MEIINIGKNRFSINVTDEAAPGTIAIHNGNAVKVTNRWNPETKIYPTYLHFGYSSLGIGDEEVIGGVVCKRLGDRDLE